MMSSVNVRSNTIDGSSRRAEDISKAGQDHYGQAQGCINLLKLIEKQENEGISVDASMTAHLTEPQREDLKALVKEAASYLVKLTAGKTEESLEISSKGHDPEAFATFQELIMGTTRKIIIPRSEHLLQRSVLITLVIGFETLLANLATAVIRDNPSVVQLENASLSLGELGSLGSVSEATDYLISRHVEDLARGSIEDWVKWFERIGVKLRDIPANWAQFREIFARRNLFVHTDGKVSSQYTSTLVSAGAKSESIPELGSSIDITNDYLAESCELIASTGALLVTSVWMKVNGKELEEPISWGLQRAEIAREDRNYQTCLQITEKLAAVLKDRADLVVDCRLKTTNWCARVMLGDEDIVAEEAGNWDVRGIDPAYSHVRSIFIGDDERALSDIVTLIEANRLPKVTVLTSVVYEKLRERLGPRVFEALGIENPRLKLDAEGGEPSLELAT